MVVGVPPESLSKLDENASAMLRYTRLARLRVAAPIHS